MIDPAPYSQARRQMVGQLARLREDIEAYARREKANPELVAFRRQLLADISAALDAMDASVEQLLAASDGQSRIAYRNGADAARRELAPPAGRGWTWKADLPHERGAKAARRADSVAGAMDRWPELY
jgi:hypothetical protein